MAVADRPRTYAVTGSASGMGAATKALLSGQGARVIGIDLHDAEVVADLGSEAGRATMVREVTQLCGGSLDGVIAAAGTGLHAPPTTIVKVNYFGGIATLDGLRPLLERSERPRAVMVTGGGLLQADPDDPLIDACLAGQEDQATALVAEDEDGTRAYRAGKRALARWVRRAAPQAEWAGAGIALNAIAPGWIDTPLAALDRFTDEQREELARAVPMPLTGIGASPSLIASVLAWLTSAENGLVTGQLVFADGGYEAATRDDDIW